MSLNDSPRFFSNQQKRALYWLANGKCEKCGCDLSDDWHADHVIPYSKGGKTDVINGQALCPICNREKGARVMTNTYYPWPDGIEPRQWQSEFLESYFSKDKDNYLVFATPGAGKTFAALMVAYQLLKRGIVSQIVTVSPTDNLRTQWTEQATILGIHLGFLGIDRLTKNATYSREDYSGISVTYAEMHSKRYELRGLCSRRPTLVILDEIHHCGNDEEGNSLEWGKAVLHAFEPCQKRLLLSGTPFRNDNHPIPFVEYEAGDDGLEWAELDFEYGYGRALQDSSGKDYVGVVRPITFPVFDSRVGWYDLTGGTFQNLSEVRARDRGKALQVALDPEGEYVRQMLEQADGRLNAIRQTSNHNNAGGLVIARSTRHANQIAKILESITGTQPYIVHSNLNVDDTNSIIERFRLGTAKWIVSVKMISEGVDIKRLRVGVYLTNIKSRVFFMQAIGRVIRWINGVEMQMAFFYFPQIEPWITYMKEITRVVKDSFDPYRLNLGRTGANGGTQSMLFVPIHGEITERSQVHDSQRFDQQTLASGVDAFGRNFPGVGMDFVRVIGEASVTRLAIQLGWVNPSPDFDGTTRNHKKEQPTPKHKEHQQWRKRADKAIKQFASILYNRGKYKNIGEAIKAVNIMYGNEHGYQNDSNPIAYYKHKEQWAQNQIKRL